MRVIAGDNKVTLQNFDKRISAAMLKKGLQYFEEGAILDIGDSSGVWFAEVEGSEIYTVRVELIKNNEIDEYTCDCPHDSDICKHLVAVFFALREEVKKKEKPKKGVKKNLFESLLEKTDADEFREFTRHYAVKNKDFKIAFELFFADKDDRVDVGAKYAELVRKLIKKYSGGRGYIDYRSSSGLSHEVTILVDKGYELVHKKNYRDAFSVAVATSKEMMEAVTFCDDSNGSISGTAFYAIELMEHIAKAEDTPVDMKEHMFTFLQTELVNKLYFDYGNFGYNLFAIFEKLAIALNKHQEFMALVDTILPTLTGKYDDYSRNFFKTAKIDFLRAIGNESAAEELVSQNMEIVSVRQGVVDTAINSKDFGKAKQLIAEGINIAKVLSHPGTVSQWEKQLLGIAMMEKDLASVRQYTFKFAFARHFDKTYYGHWKETYSIEEWPAIVEDLISKRIEHVKKSHKSNSWSSLNSELLDALDMIYVEEKYWNRLFDLVKNEKALHTLLKYHAHLSKQYPEELLQLYLPALELDGDNSSNRDHYAQLAGVMQMLIKDFPFGKAAIMDVANRLKLKYPRKPAMIQELNSVI